MLLKDNTVYQRDAFWSEIYKIAKIDKDVVVISADMGAPSLDAFRKDLASQFINAGIAEQNATLIASGLTLMGKKVYTYGIAPFVTLRCLEQVRVENAIMGIPITIVGVGTSFGYDDSGPTHHLIEDIAIMRAMPNIDIYSITDSVMAKELAHITHHSKRTSYLRVERKLYPNIYDENSDFSQSFATLFPGEADIILSTGSMTFVAIEIADELNRQGFSIGVIDVYKFPVNEGLLIEKLKNARKIFSLEEHFLPGGFGSMIAEILVDNDIRIPLKRLGLSHAKSYCYQYGGREEIRKYYGIGKEDIKMAILSKLRG